MSPLEFFQHLGSSLPAGAKLRSFAVELPDGSVWSSTFLPPHAAPAPAAALDTLHSEPAAAACPAPGDRIEVRDDADAGARENRRERVARFRQKNGGDASLKPKEWAAITRISEREIRRAIKAGALPSGALGSGRDHLAKVVTADAMEAYLATVDMVLTGRAEPPAWWKGVRG